tara:strand:- start:47 stop:316 length:270 start_codon:yes stop_codon:yes gene_type:complete
MKMQQDHFDHMKQVIDDYIKDNPDVVNNYETGNFYNSDKVQVLQIRFNYDMLYASGLNKFVCDTLYNYLNDTHITTALKNICPTVQRKY